MSKTQRKDAYQQVTDLIIEALESGVRPWSRPWSGDHAAPRIIMPLRHNGEAYRGINILILWSVAMKQGYQSPHWMTYKQAKELGGQVRKGEKSSPVFYAGQKIIEDEAAADDEDEKIIHYMKSYRVFNVEQIEDLPERFYFRPDPPAPSEEVQRIPAADTFIAQTYADIRHGGNYAYYSMTLDQIQMPIMEAFKTNHAYYSTFFHELTHWTKHRSRLDRNFNSKKFGDSGYAFEELIAELGAAFLSVDLDILPDIEGDHAAYLDHWLKILKEDNRAIFRAASFAQKAADYLHELQPFQAAFC